MYTHTHTHTHTHTYFIFSSFLWSISSIVASPRRVVGGHLNYNLSLKYRENNLAAASRCGRSQKKGQLVYLIVIIVIVIALASLYITSSGQIFARKNISTLSRIANPLCAIVDISTSLRDVTKSYIINVRKK